MYHTEIALMQAGRYQEALDVLRVRAKHLRNDPDLYCNMGIALDGLGRGDEAEHTYRMVLEWKPGHKEAVCNLADLLARTGRLAEGRALLEPVAEVDSGARRQLAMVKIEQLHIEEAVADLLAVAEASKSPQAYSEYLAYSLHLGYDRAAHERWLINFVQWRPAPAPTWDGRRNIRIGYIGDYFRKCAVASVLEPVLESHGFDVYLYGGPLRDEAGRRMATYPAVKAYLDISQKHWGVVIEQMKRDGVDCLIDLAGHNRGRMDVVARFPAQLQYTYIGYAGDTLMGRNIDREVGWAYRHPEVLPDQHFAKGPFTLGSVNRAAKITMQTMKWWGEFVRDASETARLKIMVAGGEKNVEARRQLERYGVPGERLELVGRRPKEVDYLAFANEIDIHLDTIPYGGGATVADMLAMGVPTQGIAEGPYAMGQQIMAGLSSGAEVAARLEALIRRELKVATCCG